MTAGSEGRCEKMAYARVPEQSRAVQGAVVLSAAPIERNPQASHLS